MNEEILKKIKFDNTINKSLKNIMEAFILFYGESERERIIEKFRNMLVIGYCKPEEMSLIIEQTEILKINQLIEEFIEKINIKNLSKQTLKRIFLDEISESDCISSLESYIDYIDENKDRLDDTLIFLNKIYKNITKENIDTLIENNYFKELDNIIPLHNEITEICKKFIISTKEYKIYLQKCNEIKDKLSKKYLQKLIIELKNKLPKEEYLKIEEEYKIIINSYNNPNISYKEIYLNKELLPSLVESFTEDKNEIINSESDYRKEIVQDERILYFKKLGLNLGDKYENYINNSETINLLPKKETVEILSQIRKELYIEMRDEYYKAIPEYQDNRKKIDELELLVKDDGYDVFAYEDEQTMIIPNIKKVDNSYIIYTLVLMYLGNDDGYMDSYLIHELNHVLEVHLIDFDGKNYKISSGWEIFTGEITEILDIKKTYLKEQEPKRQYELFNEIINELISQEITEILFNNNYYIFNTRETADYKGTNYEHTRFLIDEFYETYKQEIIQSRKNANINIIYETVGKENFDALNELFNIFYKNFSEDTIFEVYESKENEIETAKTKLYDELSIKRDKILLDMKKYNKQKTRKLSV